MKSPHFESLRARARTRPWRPSVMKDPAYRLSSGFVCEDRVTDAEFMGTREFYWITNGILYNLELSTSHLCWSILAGSGAREIYPLTKHTLGQWMHTRWMPTSRTANGRRAGKSALARERRHKQRVVGNTPPLAVRRSWRGLSVKPTINSEWTQWDLMTNPAPGAIDPGETIRVEAYTLRWGVLIRATVNFDPRTKLNSDQLLRVLTEIRQHYRTPGRLSPDLLRPWDANQHQAWAQAVSRPPPWREI